MSDIEIQHTADRLGLSPERLQEIRNTAASRSSEPSRTECSEALERLRRAAEAVDSAGWAA